MSAPSDQTDRLLATWLNATARPIPSFVPRRSRSRPRAATYLAIGVILAVALLGAVLIGGLLERSRGPVPPAELAATAVEALASAPGVSYALTISSRDESGTMGLDARGSIDFQHRRFSGVADAGAGQFMLLFGGPQSGAAIVADGLYVQTEGGPWERISKPNAVLDHLTDSTWLSTALERWLASSRIDPGTRFAPCGTETCQVVGVTVPPQALYQLTADLVGANVTEPPSDLGPIDAALSIDPSGFPIRLATQVTAGGTTTALTLDLVRLDPAPSITPPIP